MFYSTLIISYHAPIYPKESGCDVTATFHVVFALFNRLHFN